MHTQSAALALRQHLKIAARLRRFDHAKGVLLPRDRQIYRIIAGNLQKNAGVWAALIGLPGGVEKAWSKAQAGSHTLTLAHTMANGLQLVFVFIAHLDVGQQCEIISRAELAQMRAKQALQR